MKRWRSCEQDRARQPDELEKIQDETSANVTRKSDLSSHHGFGSLVEIRTLNREICIYYQLHRAGVVFSGGCACVQRTATTPSLVSEPHPITNKLKTFILNFNSIKFM